MAWSWRRGSRGSKGVRGGRGGRVRGCVLGLAATAMLMAAGCGTGTDPFAFLDASGTVTAAGEPAPARITLSAGSFSTTQEYPDGSYSITVGGGGVPASNCADAWIRAELLAPDRSVLDEQTRTLGACGQHVVDFTFP